MPPRGGGFLPLLMCYTRNPIFDILLYVSIFDTRGPVFERSENTCRLVYRAWTQLDKGVSSEETLVLRR